MSTGYKMNLSGKECYCQVFSEGRTNKEGETRLYYQDPGSQPWPQQSCKHSPRASQAGIPSTCPLPFPGLAWLVSSAGVRGFLGNSQWGAEAPRLRDAGRPGSMEAAGQSFQWWHSHLQGGHHVKKGRSAACPLGWQRCPMATRAVICI